MTSTRWKTRITMMLALTIGGMTLAGATGATAGAQPAAPAQHVTVTPSAVRPGERMTISGRLECPASAPGGHVLLRADYFDPDDRFGLWLQYGLVDDYPPLTPERTFSVTVTLPTSAAEYGRGEMPVHPMPPGEHEITVTCDESDGETDDDIVRGTFTVLPLEDPTTTTTTTTVPPTTTTTEPATTFVPPAEPPTIAEVFENRPIGAIPAGSIIDIDEDGFIHGEEVHVVLYSSPRVLATIIADATGAVRDAITIPADTEPGAHVLVLYGSQLVRAMALDITAPDTEPRTPDPTTPPGPDATPDPDPTPDATDPGTGTGTGGGTGKGGGTGTPAAAQLPRTGIDGTVILTLVGTALLATGTAALRLSRGLTIVRR